MYLYRAVDARSKTVESHLSRTRDITAAKAFLRKALKHHGQRRTITLDGFEPTHSALRRMGMRNEFNRRWDNPVKIRSCQCLNNVVEQDQAGRAIHSLSDARWIHRFYRRARHTGGADRVRAQHEPHRPWRE